MTQWTLSKVTTLLRLLAFIRHYEDLWAVFAGCKCEKKKSLFKKKIINWIKQNRQWYHHTDHSGHNTGWAGIIDLDKCCILGNMLFVVSLAAVLMVWLQRAPKSTLWPCCEHTKKTAINDTFPFLTWQNDLLW